MDEADRGDAWSPGRSRLCDMRSPFGGQKVALGQVTAERRGLPEGLLQVEAAPNCYSAARKQPFGSDNLSRFANGQLRIRDYQTDVICRNPIRRRPLRPLGGFVVLSR